MKQRITPEQLRELTPEQQEMLREWWKPRELDVCVGSDDFIFSVGMVREKHTIKGKRDLWFWPAEEGSAPLTKADCLPLLSIGQMIELIYVKSDMNWRSIGNIISEGWGYALDNANKERELADTLWQMVKAKL